jgi:hypothetical protein
MNKSMCGQYWQRITSWLSQMEGNCINSTWPFLCSLNISNLFLLPQAPRGAYTCLKKSMGMIFSKWAQKILLNSWTISLFSGWSYSFVSALVEGLIVHFIVLETVGILYRSVQWTHLFQMMHTSPRKVSKYQTRVLGVVIQANMNVPW